jgi:hypothetical protein
MTEKLTFEWTKGETGVLWLAQPAAEALGGGPPYGPKAGRCAWEVLSRAFECDAKEAAKRPVVFVAPELSVDAKRVDDIVKGLKSLPDNRLVIAGLGHLRQDECEALEKNTGASAEFWKEPWGPGAYANVALVATKSEVFIQPKGLPSYDERAAACFIGGSRLRVFEGKPTDGVPLRFAVTICSEWLEDGDPNGFARRVVAEKPDVIFWIQHNPKPRSAKFHDRLLSLFEHGRTLVVAANCSPGEQSRLQYGASGLIFTENHVLPSSKHMLCKSADYCTEAAVPGRSITRVAFPRYDVAVHRIHTILPRDLAAYGADDAVRGRFVEAVHPYVVENAALVRDQRPGFHIADLFKRGEPKALALAALPAELFVKLSGIAQVIQNDLKKPNWLSVFLDHALVQREDPKHLNYEDHPDGASCCACWDHRISFDSLFDEAKEMPGKIAELVLALAALGGRVSLDRKRREYWNAKVRDSPVLIATHSGSEDSFEQSYFRGHPVLRHRPTVVLRAVPSPRIGRIDAARIDPRGEVDQAVAQMPEPLRLCGADFWKSVVANTVLDDLGIPKERADANL